MFDCFKSLNSRRRDLLQTCKFSSTSSGLMNCQLTSASFGTHLEQGKLRAMKIFRGYCTNADHYKPKIEFLNCPLETWSKNFLCLRISLRPLHAIIVRPQITIFRSVDAIKKAPCDISNRSHHHPFGVNSFFFIHLNRLIRASQAGPLYCWPEFHDVKAIKTLCKVWFLDDTDEQMGQTEYVPGNYNAYECIVIVSPTEYLTSLFALRNGCTMFKKNSRIIMRILRVKLRRKQFGTHLLLIRIGPASRHTIRRSHVA